LATPLRSPDSKIDRNATGDFNADDETVLAVLTRYQHSIGFDGNLPGELSLKALSSVPYIPDSPYAKKTQSKKESYFAKFEIEYPLSDPVRSKYV